MKRFFLDKKTKILILIILNLGFSFSMTYAYWASEISGSLDDDSVNLSIGEFPIAISTPEQFYEFATKSNSSATDDYYIKNDLDFTGFDWTYNASNHNVIFRGKLNGNGKTISNLTINNFSSTYLYHGIFPRMDGGTIVNLRLDNVNLELNATSLSGTAMRSGLITGNIYNGKVNTLSEITIINSGVRGTSTNGVGGLIGFVQTNNTVVNISNIKATQLRVFNKNANTGGLIGRIDNSVTVSISDIDIDGEVYAHPNASYTGGIIGRVSNASNSITLSNIIVEMGSQNTLETNSTYNLLYSKRYLGGIIGYSLTPSANMSINNAIFLGSLYTNANNRRNDVGTVTGRATVANSPVLNTVFYSFVAFRSNNGSVVYSPDGTPTGQMSTVVVEDNYPGSAWWNSAYAILSADNPYWLQDPITSRPYLEF